MGNQGNFFSDASANSYSIEDAARSGNIDAINELSTTYMNQMDYNNARYWAKFGTAQNDAWSMHIMGYMAQEEENYREAIKWYERNININSFSLSASNLANIYMNFEENPSMPTDREKGAYLYQLAFNSDRENGYACFGLGVCYACGLGVEENENIARQYLHMSCNLGPANIANEARSILNDMQNNQNLNNNNGGCFITTAVCDSFGKSDNCYELSMFRHFRDTWLSEEPDGESLIKEYYEIAPQIVSCINKNKNANDIYRMIWQNYLSTCLKYLEEGKPTDCKEKYVAMVRFLKQGYLS